VSVAAEDEDAFVALATRLGVPATRVGETGGPRVVIEGAVDVLVGELAEIWETAIPRLLGEAV
jgi:hypothetical protein